MSSRTPKGLVRLLILVPVASFLYGSTAVADDAQALAARVLLGSRTQTSSAAQPAVTRVTRDAVKGDAQALAQRVLLGTAGSPPARVRYDIAREGGTRVRADAHLHARQVLLGAHDESAAGS
jgi:hypothetical protein